MKRRFVAVFMAAGLAMMSLAGCGAKDKPVTAQSLLEEIETKSKDMKSMTSHLTMDMTMEGEQMASMGVDSVSVTMDADNQVTQDPVASYINGKMSLMGMDLDMEIYTVLEGDELVNYMGMMGSWMYQRMPFDKEAVNNISANAGTLLEHLDSLTLQEEPEDIDGKPAYIINGTLEGEEMMELLGQAQSVLGTATGMEDLIDEADMDDLSMDFKYAVDQESRLPVYADFTFNGFEKLTGQEGVTISNFTMRTDYTGFDNVEKIEVPQEVKDSAQEITAEDLVTEETETE